MAEYIGSTYTRIYNKSLCDSLLSYCQEQVCLHNSFHSTAPSGNL